MTSLKEKAARYRTVDGDTAGSRVPAPQQNPADHHAAPGMERRSFSGLSRRRPVPASRATSGDQEQDRPQGTPPLVAPTAAWNDPNRPEGSGFTEEEWLAAEDGGRNVVFEVVKPAERGLVAIERSNVDPVHELLLERSLLVPSRHALARGLPCDARVIHRDESINPDGPIEFNLVRTHRARSETGHYNGSILRTAQEMAYQEREKAKKEPPPAQRFGEIPRGR